MTNTSSDQGSDLLTAEQERDRLIAVLQAQGELQDLYIRNGSDRAW